MKKSNIRRKKYIFTSGSEWNVQILEEIEKYCSEIALEELKLNIFPNQIEIVNYEQMLDIYSSDGLPVLYPHWSFGKKFYQNEKMYQKGVMNLAYEVVINSNPCISYLMETNSTTLQMITIAHACFGHNHFFKNNYLFKEYTQPESIINYLIFAKNFIMECEEKYGIEEVEKILDACHTIKLYGVSKYKKKKKLSEDEIKRREQEKEEELRKRVSDFWDKLVEKKSEENTDNDKIDDFIYPEEENLLYFIEKNSPILEPWQREICRIVRKISQYFYPQLQTKIMNEGFASFVHNYIVNRLYEKGLIDDGTMLEYLKIHTNVLYWKYFSEYHFYSHFNPYSLGFEIFSEIKRICENLNDEDNHILKSFSNNNWVDCILNAVESYRDESFILQFLTKNLVKKHRLFSIYDDENLKHYIVDKIHDDRGYESIKKNLSEMFNYNLIVPEIVVEKVNFKGDRTLYLKHNRIKNINLNNKTIFKVLQKIKRLWGFKIVLNSVDVEGFKTVTYSSD